MRKVLLFCRIPDFAHHHHLTWFEISRYPTLIYVFNFEIHFVIYCLERRTINLINLINHANMENQAPLITLDDQAVKVLKSFMKDQDVQKVIRIDLGFKGCCDPALELSLDTRAEHDLFFDQEGVSLVMSPKTHDVAGNVYISYTAETGRTGFIISPSKPISEWDGFGVCQIKV